MSITSNNTFVVKNGLTVNNSIVIDTNRNISNVSNLSINGTIKVASVDLYGLINAISSTSGLPLSGGTLTGPLVLNADPVISNVNPLTAATREYVDVGQFGNLVFAYNVTSGALNTVTNPDGSNSVFTYNATGILSSVKKYRPGYNTVTKTFSYTNGVLTGISTTSP